jgi:hypothetical protein
MKKHMARLRLSRGKGLLKGPSHHERAWRAVRACERRLMAVEREVVRGEHMLAAWAGLLPGAPARPMPQVRIVEVVA